MLFETDRLILRKLLPLDRDAFFDLMSNPNVMHPIPRKEMDRVQSDEEFEKHLFSSMDSNTKVYAICVKNNKELIGIAAYLKNDNDENEIGYRLREQFWGKGYGTEVTKGLIEHGFGILNFKEITADVYVENKRSVKILETFFISECEFFNPKDQCMDRRYRITKDKWFQ